MGKTTAKPLRNGNARGKQELSVLTLAEAAGLLKLTEPAVQRLALSGRLPGRIVEGQWRFLESALATWLTGSDFEPKQPGGHLSDRERLLSVIGCMADDESLEPMVEEIYRERKKHLVGDLQ